VTAPCHLVVAGEVATITLDRPDTRNALSDEMIESLNQHMKDAVSREDVRVIVVTGTGSAFSSGADLKERGDGYDTARRAAASFISMVHAIRASTKPVIARVNGHVAGGGNGLVAACDLAIASDDATFAFREVRIGVAPAMISVLCLPKLTPADAAELFLTGERISAERARHAGLINRTVPHDQLDRAVRVARTPWPRRSSCSTAFQGWTSTVRSSGPLKCPRTCSDIPRLKRESAPSSSAAPLRGTETARAGRKTDVSGQP
jgi:methylglutaconyl-CoA hydratase